MTYIIQNTRTGLYVAGSVGVGKIKGVYSRNEATIYDSWEEAEKARVVAMKVNPRGEYTIRRFK